MEQKSLEAVRSALALGADLKLALPLAFSSTLPYTVSPWPLLTLDVFPQ